jgi:hypothetical protein
MHRACIMHGEVKKKYRIFVGEPGKKRSLGRSTCK